MSAQPEMISETEARMAVLNYTYHSEVSKKAFLEKIAAATSIAAHEADLAWEIIDYLEWQHEA